MKSTLSTLIIISMLACLSAATGSEPSNKTEYSYELNSGIYCFTVEPSTYDPSLVAVMTKFQSKKPNGLGSISDEALALTKLLNELKQRHLGISHFYIPTTFQAEVVERVQAAAIKSNAWRKSSSFTAGIPLLQMINDSNAYGEIRAALNAYGCDIKTISFEHIFVKPLPNSKVRVPWTWDTFITVTQVRK